MLESRPYGDDFVADLVGLREALQLLLAARGSGLSP
jgi:hypothetical protein